MATTLELGQDQWRFQKLLGLILEWQSLRLAPSSNGLPRTVAGTASELHLRLACWCYKQWLGSVLHSASPHFFFLCFHVLTFPQEIKIHWPRYSTFHLIKKNVFVIGSVVFNYMNVFEGMFLITSLTKTFLVHFVSEFLFSYRLMIISVFAHIFSLEDCWGTTNTWKMGLEKSENPQASLRNSDSASVGVKPQTPEHSECQVWEPLLIMLKLVIAKFGDFTFSQFTAWIFS